MAKALSREQADEIIPSKERAAARKAERRTQQRSEAAIKAREGYALGELERLGARVTVYTPPQHVDPDPLREIAGGFKLGQCFATVDSVDGKRKTWTGASAVDTLDQVRLWLKHQDNLKPEFRFKLAGGAVAVPVRHEVAGDRAHTERRRRETSRRVISLEGTPEITNTHGDPRPR